jgi:hypothetical protein
MRLMLALAALLLGLPALAQQAGTVSFGAPTTGGTPSGYRLYRDNVLVGPVASGQTIANLFPANVGSWAFTVEAFNTTGPGPRASVTVSLGPPIPGAPVQIVITAPCVAAGTCVITVAP